jgi:hypothetical protein
MLSFMQLLTVCFTTIVVLIVASIASVREQFVGFIPIDRWHRSARH